MILLDEGLQVTNRRAEEVPQSPQEIVARQKYRCIADSLLVRWVWLTRTVRRPLRGLLHGSPRYEAHQDRHDP